MRRASFSALTIVFALLFVSTVCAQGGQDARELFQRGQAAYQQGDYETAVRNWTAAYDADPRPLIQFNLAQAYGRLNRLEEAAAAFDLYLANADPSDASQADARAQRASLRERLTRTGLILEGGPSGASIVIDDRPWGVTPRPDAIRLDPGSHSVVVTKEGFRDFHSSIVVPAGETVTVTVEMEEARGGGGGAGGEERTVLGDEEGPGVWPWITVGAGGALVVVGAIVGVVALNQADAGHEVARGLAATADVLSIVGGLAIAGGLTWFFLSQGGSDDEAEGASQAQLRIAPALGPTLVGAVAEGTF